MIDWLSFSLPYLGPTVGVQFYRREHSEAPIDAHTFRPMQFEGSYSSKMQVQVIGGRMYISGNPVKFFSGQNAVGTNDIWRLISMTYSEVLERLNLPHCVQAHRAIDKGYVELTRVDCTFSYHVGTDDDVVTWLSAMESCSHARYRGRGHFDKGMCSLMYGLRMKEGQKPKGSRRSSFKFYNKYKEMSVHKPTCSSDMALVLRELMLGKVRAEACYRGMELKKLGYNSLRKWTDSTCRKLHKMWIDKLEISENVVLRSEQENELPRAVLSTYRHWRSGADLMSLLSRPTFYRHRKVLLEHGLDISAGSGGVDPVIATPVIRVLEASEVCEKEQEKMFWGMVRAA